MPPILLFCQLPSSMCSPCFNFKQIFEGASLVPSLGYSNGFFVILQILSSMLVINTYSIIDSKVFDLTIDENFLFAIVIKRFYNYKHTVEEKRMQLENTHVNNAN